MPDIEVDGARLYYEEHGEGDETVVFAHGLLFDTWMWQPQVAALAGRYRCLAFDFRGHGRSERTRSGYDMETLAEDTAALVAALGRGPCHFVGLSMGGFVGLRLAARRPELVRSLTVMDSSADPEDPANARRYRMLAFVARWLGLRAVADGALPIMFSEETLADPARRAHWKERVVANDRKGVTRAALGVVNREGVASELARIRAPTLVLVGEKDVATPPHRARAIHQGIEGSELVIVPRAGHMASVEQPELVNRALAGFLDRVSAAG